MRDFFIYRKEWLDSLRALPVQVRGEVNAAIIEYGIAEELIPLKATARAVFALIKADMDRNRKTTSEDMRRLAQKRWGTNDRKTTDAAAYTTNAKPRCNRGSEAYAAAYQANAKEVPPFPPLEEKSPTPPKEDKPPITPQERPPSWRAGEKTAGTAGKFTPPTREEVARYCEERRNGIDPDCFTDFYTANGWMQNRGKPIKDWKAAVRTWERRKNYEYGTTTQRPDHRDGRAADSHDGDREAERQRRLQGYANVAMRFISGKDTAAVADGGNPLGDVSCEPADRTDR